MQTFNAIVAVVVAVLLGAGIIGLVISGLAFLIAKLHPDNHDGEFIS